MEIEVTNPEDIVKSSTDINELSARLETWLQSHQPGARIVELTSPGANGMSSETLLVDVEWEENGTLHVAAAGREIVDL